MAAVQCVASPGGSPSVRATMPLPPTWTPSLVRQQHQPPTVGVKVARWKLTTSASEQTILPDDLVWRVVAGVPTVT